MGGMDLGTCKKKKKNTAFLFSPQQLWQGLGPFQRFKSNVASAQCHEVRTGLGHVGGGGGGRGPTHPGLSSICPQAPAPTEPEHRKMTIYSKCERNNVYNIGLDCCRRLKHVFVFMTSKKKNHDERSCAPQRKIPRATTKT